MKKTLIPIFSFILLVLLYGAFLSQYSLEVLPASLVNSNPKGYNDYKGVLNIHSLKSTGSGTVASIIEAARENDIQFLIFNELNPFDQKPQNPKYFDEILVSFDGEYSFRNSRILNLMSSTGLEFDNAAQVQMLLPNQLESADRSPGEREVFVIAHPLKPRFQWREELPPGVSGIEVINLKTIWQKAWLEKKVSFVWTLFTYIFNRELALARLFDGQEDEIIFWDKHLKQRRVVGFAGSDAEAKIRISSGTYIQFPTYKTLLGLVSNHVLLKSELTGDVRDDHKKIKYALSKGNFYMSFDALANPKGFIAKLAQPGGKEYLMGSDVTLTNGTELKITLPQKPNTPFDVIIYRNGKKEFTSNSLETKWVIHEPGIYRVLVRVIPTFPIPDGKKWIPWIYTNAFYVKDR